MFATQNLDEIPAHDATSEKRSTTRSRIYTKSSNKVTQKPTTKTTPIKHKKSKLKFLQEVMNEITADEKYINNEYFKIILSIRIHRF